MPSQTQLEILRQKSTAREDLGLLAVMDVLEKRERITQRELARVTGLTLKKVNYSLGKLLEKGHVKFQRARNANDRRAYLYVLTPSGLKAKSRLTYRFLKFTLNFYGKMEQKLSDCLREMEQARIRRLVLLGATDVARILMELAEKHGVTVVGVIDPAFTGSGFHGAPVVELEWLGDHEWDAVLITDWDDPDGAAAYLTDHGIAREGIWQLS